MLDLANVGKARFDFGLIQFCKSICSDDCEALDNTHTTSLSPSQEASLIFQLPRAECVVDLQVVQVAVAS